MSKNAQIIINECLPLLMIALLVDFKHPHGMVVEGVGDHAHLQPDGPNLFLARLPKVQLSIFQTLSTTNS